ncbi:ZIP family metal transporter [Piscibacillus sp. B03]|uniref:ZIP family metal transporter n=1 Tax=Piscibacillus sp. B03 TaxID=3457430 RepID=UPI003FCC7E51
MSAAWLIGSLASALGIGVGGGIAWFMKRIKHGFSVIYSICTGLILGLLFFELIPESVELGGWLIFFIGTIIGLLLFHSIHLVFDKIIIITDSPQKDIFVRSGVLLTISIALHNFPVGVALGPTIGTDIGTSILSTLILHNIPEGMIIFTPLFLAGFGPVSWLLFTFFISIPIAAGSFLGQFLEIRMPFLIALFINIAITIIFMVAIKELFSEAIKHSSLLKCLFWNLSSFGMIYLYLRV